MLKKFLLCCVLCAMPLVSARALTCGVGEYIDGEICRTCPVNATCNDGIEFICNDGWYKSGAICTKCSVENSTCTGADDYSCNPGFYDDAGICKMCVANATCAGGHEWFHCQSGFYKQVLNGKEVACLSCEGHVCDGEKIISCGEGFFLHGSGQCLNCSPGYYCPGAGVVGITCKEGYYRDANGVCSRCGIEYYCPLGESNLSNLRAYCAAGYYKTGNTCTKCNDGSVCPGGKIMDMTCPDGLFLHDDGRCLAYAPGDCGVAPICNPGCYDNDGVCVKCNAEHSTCTDADNFSCVAGYYKNGNLCDICPTNSTCAAGSEQISCIDGYFLENGQCIMCPRGYYCVSNTKAQCPEYVPGIVKPDIPDEYNVIDARISTETTSGATDIKACRLYLRLGTPQGEFEYLYGLNYNNGYYRIQANVQRWDTANVGFYLVDEVAAWNGVWYRDVQKCTNGAENSYYTSAGTPEGNDCAWVCNDGYYRDGNVCKVCPEGMECLAGGIMCPVGMYARDGTCVACPDGYADNPNRGAQSENECQIKCAGGSYLPVAGGVSCTNVGAGYWINENFTNYGATGVRNQCPTGLTTIGYGPGADEEADCGYILRLGDNHKIYLRSDRKTRPTLNVLVGDTVYYGNMGVLSRKGLKVQLGDTIYTVYDDASAD